MKANGEFKGDKKGKRSLYERDAEAEAEAEELYTREAIYALMAASEGASRGSKRGGRGS